MTVRTEVAELAEKLVAINSANPHTQVDGPGERCVARFCEAWLRAVGLHARSVLPVPEIERPAVVAALNGQYRHPTILLVGHLDTYAWFEPPPADPSKLVVRGAGAVDMKGGVAVAMVALRRLMAAGIRGRVVGMFLPDEEHGSLGARRLAPRLDVDAAIVLEDTGLCVGASHAGSVTVTLDASGGISPRLVVDLGASSRRLRAQGFHETLGARCWTYSITKDPPRVVLRQRLLPGDDADSVLREVERIVSGARAPLYWDVREPFVADPDLVDVIGRQLRGVGADPTAVALEGWTEAAVFAGHRIPTVVFGPGGGGAHTTDEWLDATEAATAVEVVVESVRELCR